MESRVYKIGGTEAAGTGIRVEHALTSLTQAVGSVSDAEVKHAFRAGTRKAKSISTALQEELGAALINLRWAEDVNFLETKSLKGGHSHFDFALEGFGIVFAFHNRGSILSNLLRPSIPAIAGTFPSGRWIGGALVTASETMKRDGGFDGAIASAADYLECAEVICAALVLPTYVVELTPPETYHVVHEEWFPGRRVGRVRER